jgi:folate-dependent phosphoribosylglycinamide formyltransferase PurN
MRIAILSSSLPAATRIYQEIAVASNRDVHVLLFLDARRSWPYNLARQAALIALHRPRLAILGLIRHRRIHLVREAAEHSKTLAQITKWQFDVGLHNLGVIYRDSMINAFRRGILNAHIGLLPKYRGRSVMEWSLLQGDPIGVSVFFVDEGIDTGQRIVLSETVDVSNCKSIAKAKEYLFDLAGQFYRRAIERIEEGNVTYQENDGSGRRYYVMSKLLQGVAEQCLAARRKA